MEALVLVACALLLAVGSGLIFVALLCVEEEDRGRVSRGWMRDRGWGPLDGRGRTSWPGREEPGRATTPTRGDVRPLALNGRR